MTPRGYLAMERFQGYDGFLGMIRFDDLWVWVGLMALVLLRLPLQICLSHSLIAESECKAPHGRLYAHYLHAYPCRADDLRGQLSKMNDCID